MQLQPWFVRSRILLLVGLFMASSILAMAGATIAQSGVITVNQVAGQTSYTVPGTGGLILSTPQISFNEVNYFTGGGQYVANRPTFAIAERVGSAVLSAYDFDVLLRFDNPDPTDTAGLCAVNEDVDPTINLIGLIDPAFTPTAGAYAMSIIPPTTGNPAVVPISDITMPADVTRGVKDATTDTSGQMNPGSFTPVVRMTLKAADRPGASCSSQFVDFVYLPITVDNVRPLLTTSAVLDGPGSTTTPAKVGDTVRARVVARADDTTVNIGVPVGEIDHAAVTAVGGIGKPAVYVANASSPLVTFNFSVKELRCTFANRANCDGPVNIPVTVLDKAGNKATIPLTVKVDTAPPLPTISSVQALTNGSIRARWGGDVLDYDVTTWKVQLVTPAGTVVHQRLLTYPANETTPTASLEVIFDKVGLSLPDGEYYVKVQGTDDAGNVGLMVTSSRVFSDLNKPTLTLNPPAAQAVSLVDGTAAFGAKAFNGQAVQGTVSDSGSGVDAVYVRVLSSNGINSGFAPANDNTVYCWRGASGGAVADNWKPCFDSTFWTGADHLPGGYVKVDGTVGSVTGTGTSRSFTLSASPDKMPSNANTQGQFKVSLLVRDRAYEAGREAFAERRIENVTYVIDAAAPSIPTGAKFHAQRLCGPIESTCDSGAPDSSGVVRQGIDLIRFQLKDSSGNNAVVSDVSGILDATLYLKENPPGAGAPRAKTVQTVPVEWTGELTPGLYSGTPRIGEVPSQGFFQFATSLLPLGNYTVGELVIRDLAGNTVTVPMCATANSDKCLNFGSLTTTALPNGAKGFSVVPRAYFQDFNLSLPNADAKFLQYYPSNNTLHFNLYLGYNNRTDRPDHANRTANWRTNADSRSLFAPSGSYVVTPETIDVQVLNAAGTIVRTFRATSWPPINPGTGGVPDGVYLYKITEVMPANFNPVGHKVRVNVSVATGSGTELTLKPRYTAFLEAGFDGAVPVVDPGKPSLKINRPASWLVSHNGSWHGDVTITPTSVVPASKTSVGFRVWRVTTAGLTQADLASLSANPVAWIDSHPSLLTNARAATAAISFTKPTRVGLAHAEWFNHVATGNPATERPLDEGLYILEARAVDSDAMNTTIAANGNPFSIASEKQYDREAVVFAVEKNRPEVTINTDDPRNQLFVNKEVFYTERNVTVVVEVDTGFGNLTNSPKSSRNPGSVNPLPVYVKLVKNSAVYGPTQTGANKIAQSFIVYNLTENREATTAELAGNDKFLLGANRTAPTATGLGTYTLAIRFRIPDAIPDNERFDLRILAVSNAGEAFHTGVPDAAARTSVETGNDVEFDSAAPTVSRLEGPVGTNATLRINNVHPLTGKINRGNLTLKASDLGAGPKSATISIYRLTSAGLVENWTGAGGWRLGVTATEYTLNAATNGGLFVLDNATSRNAFLEDGSLFQSGRRLYYVRVHLVDNLSNAGDDVIPVSVDQGPPSVLTTPAPPSLSWIRPADVRPNNALASNAHVTFKVHAMDDMPTNIVRAEVLVKNPFGETYAFPATASDPQISGGAIQSMLYTFNLSGKRAFWWSGDYNVSFRFTDAVGNTFVHMMKADYSQQNSAARKFTVLDTLAPAATSLDMHAVGSETPFRKNVAGQSIVDGTSPLELRVTVEENTALAATGRDAWFLLGATNQKYGPFTLLPVEGKVSARNGSGIYRVDLSIAPRSGPALPARQDGQLWNISIALSDTGKNSQTGTANKLTETKLGAFYVFNNLAPFIERASPTGGDNPVIKTGTAVTWTVIDVNTAHSGIALKVSRDGGAPRDETANLTIARPTPTASDRWSVTWTPKNVPHGTKLDLILTATDSLLNATSSAVSLSVDGAAPEATSEFEGPTRSQNGKLYVGPATLVRLAATDAEPSIGGLSLYYKLPGDSAFRLYAAPFVIPADSANPNADRTITYYAVDGAGNKGTEATRTVVVDDRAPLSSLVALGNEGDRAVRIRASDLGVGVAPDRVTLHLRGNAPGAGTTYTPFDMTAGAEGAFTAVLPDALTGPACYYITVEDHVGNVGGPGLPRYTAEAPYCFTLPNRAPTLTIRAPEDSKTFRGPFRVDWLGEDPDGDSLTFGVALESATGAIYDMPPSTNGLGVFIDPADMGGRAVPDGTYRLIVTAEDPSGEVAVDDLRVTLANAEATPQPVTPLPSKTKEGSVVQASVRVEPPAPTLQVESVAALIHYDGATTRVPLTPGASGTYLLSYAPASPGNYQVEIEVKYVDQPPEPAMSFGAFTVEQKEVVVTPTTPTTPTTPSTVSPPDNQNPSPGPEAKPVPGSLLALVALAGATILVAAYAVFVRWSK